MKVRRFNSKNKLNEAVINTKSFMGIKVKAPCKKKLFEEFPNDAFIIVFDDTGKVIIYDEKHKNTFNNLREVVELFGSKFFKYSILGSEFGDKLKEFYETKTGMKIRNIYKYDI